MICEHFTLPVKAPFRLELTAWALKRREKNQIDLWDGHVYTRVFCMQNTAVKVEVMQKDRSHISIDAKASRKIPHLKKEIATALNRMLGLQIDMRKFYEWAKKDRVVRPLVEEFRGVKPPRFPSLFETLTNAICCQQLSLEAGLTILNNLAQAYGKVYREKHETLHAFPEARRIAKCRAQELMSLGFSRNKSVALISLAKEISSNPTLFLKLEEMNDDAVIDFLIDFKGIGRWSAEYTLLRGLGRTEILPGDDVGIHKSIKKLLRLRSTPIYEKIKQIEKNWHPFAGLMYFHILLEKLNV